MSIKEMIADSIGRALQGFIDQDFIDECVWDAINENDIRDRIKDVIETSLDEALDDLIG